MKTEDVSLTIGDHAMDAYLAIPDGDARVPGVLVIQEIFGVNREIKRICDLLARTGYLAFAPNVFHRTHPKLDAGYNPEGMGLGRAAAGAATMEGLKADLDASIAFMQQHPRSNGELAAWGFCFGGTIAYWLATFPAISASVSFYGGQIAKATAPHRPPAIEFTKDIHAPIFLAFGGKDESIPPEEIEKIRAALDAQHKTYQLEVYPDEGHGFFRHGVNGESTPGARDIWPKVQHFLREHLTAKAAV